VPYMCIGQPHGPCDPIYIGVQTTTRTKLLPSQRLGWYRTIEPYKEAMLSEDGCGNTYGSYDMSDAARECMSAHEPKTAEHVTWLNEVRC
jgi:hypothetical protein